MAKTRPAGKKSGKKSKGSSGGSSGAAGAGQSPQVSVMEAEIAMTQGDVEAALRAALRAKASLEAARVGSDSNIVVDGVGLAAVCALVGEIYLESGEVAEARSALEAAVALDTDGTLPDTLGGGVDKYLYLAQLSDEGGRDSLRWFERGIAGLRARAGQLHKDVARPGAARATADAATELDVINGKIAQILCAMAEVWMTDLSFEDDCEQQCEQLTTEATLVEPRSVEAWQTLASVRISQSREEEARAALQRSLDLWSDLPLDDAGVPAFSERVSLVRMLLTVGWTEQALDVAADLLREDEQSVEVWYLAGYANYLAGQALAAGSADKTAAWTEARRCLGRCLKRFGQQAYEDERLGEHARELMAELVEAVGAPPQAEIDEEDFEDEAWEDEEGEDEGEGEDEEMQG